MSLQVEVVSPERILWSGQADSVIARTVGGGDIAFLAGHAPFVGALEIWRVDVVSGGQRTVIAVHGGFIEVSNNAVTILSDVAELADQIDSSRAQEAKSRAEDAVRADADDDAAAGALRRAEVRLEVAGA